MAIDRITTNGIKDGTITNTDVSTTAGIAGSKISAINFLFIRQMVTMMQYQLLMVSFRSLKPMAHKIT